MFAIFPWIMNYAKLLANFNKSCKISVKTTPTCGIIVYIYLCIHTYVVKPVPDPKHFDPHCIRFIWKQIFFKGSKVRKNNNIIYYNIFICVSIPQTSE